MDFTGAELCKFVLWYNLNLVPGTQYEVATARDAPLFFTPYLGKTFSLPPR